MEMQGKAKFVWVDDYYHSHWLLTEFEGNEDYDIAPGFEMPESFVAEWAASHKKVEALEDLLVEKQRMLDTTKAVSAYSVLRYDMNLLDTQDVVDILDAARFVIEQRNEKEDLEQEVQDDDDLKWEHYYEDLANGDAK